MNFIHGFESKNIELNPDSIAIANTLKSADLCLAEDFLQGSSLYNPIHDPVKAHEIVKIIYKAGKRKHPTLWDSADYYINSDQYWTLENLIKQ